MAHPEQQIFCKSVRDMHPEKFTNCDVLDVGSMDINGNNRYLFTPPFSYTGIDLGSGTNVDIISPGHLYSPNKKYDVVISTECFEHDTFWRQTIRNCIKLTKPEGIFLFSCAAVGRQEHGTTRTSPKDSPFTNDYYHNLTEMEILSIEGFAESFSKFSFSKNNNTKDLYFYGIRK